MIHSNFMRWSFDYIHVIEWIPNKLEYLPQAIVLNLALEFLWPSGVSLTE